MTEEFNEDIASQNDEQDVDLEENNIEEDSEDEGSNEDFSEREKELYARAKKAETKLKTLKEVKVDVKPKVNKTNEASSGVTRHEAILIAKGATEEDLELVNKLADINGISVLEAWEDDYIQNVITKRTEDEKTKANQIGASTGSPSSGKKQKAIGKMTREEHEEFMKQRLDTL